MAVRSLIDTTIATFGRLDIAFNLVRIGRSAGGSERVRV